MYRKTQAKVLKDIFGPAKELEKQIEALEIIIASSTGNTDLLTAALVRLKGELRDINTVTL